MKTEYVSCIFELIKIISQRIMKDNMCCVPRMRDILISIAPLPLQVNTLSGSYLNYINDVDFLA